MPREKGKMMHSEKTATAKTTVMPFTFIPQFQVSLFLLASSFIYF
jgi:hypothetical protein